MEPTKEDGPCKQPNLPQNEFVSQSSPESPAPETQPKSPGPRRTMSRHLTHSEGAVKVIEKLKTQELKSYCWVRKGKGLTGSKWKYRWFELKKNRLVIKKDEDQPETGKEKFILIEENTKILPSKKVPPTRTLFGFKIMTDRTTYHLAAPSKKLFSDWTIIIEEIVKQQTQISLTDQLHYLEVYSANSNVTPNYPVLDLQVVEVVAQCKSKIMISIYHGTQRLDSWPMASNDNLNFGGTFMFPICDVIQAKISTAKKKIGEVQISLTRFGVGQLIDEWFPLRSSTGAVSSLLRLRLHKTLSKLPCRIGVPGGRSNKWLPLRLDTGDVLLWHNVNLGSIGTSLVTSSQWNHVGIIVQWTDLSLKVLQATSEGVTLDALDDIVERARGATLAVRKLATDNRPFRQKLLYKFITSVEGRPFTSDMKTFINGFLNANSQKDEDANSFFCSHLVGAAFVSMQLLQDDVCCSNFLPRHWSTFNSFLGDTQLSEKYVFDIEKTAPAKPLKPALKGVAYEEYCLLTLEEFEREIVSPRRQLDGQGREQKLATWQLWDFHQRLGPRKSGSGSQFRKGKSAQDVMKDSDDPQPAPKLVLTRRHSIGDLRSLSSRSSEDSSSRQKVSHNMKPRISLSDSPMPAALLSPGNAQRSRASSQQERSPRSRADSIAFIPQTPRSHHKSSSPREAKESSPRTVVSDSAPNVVPPPSPKKSELGSGSSDPSIQTEKQRMKQKDLTSSSENIVMDIQVLDVDSKSSPRAKSPRYRSKRASDVRPPDKAARQESREARKARRPSNLLASEPLIESHPLLIFPKVDKNKGPESASPPNSDEDYGGDQPLNYSKSDGVQLLRKRRSSDLKKPRPRHGSEPIASTN